MDAQGNQTRIGRLVADATLLANRYGDDAEIETKSRLVDLSFRIQADDLTEVTERSKFYLDEFAESFAPLNVTP